MSGTLKELKERAQLCMDTALKEGASEIAIGAYQSRVVELSQRDKKLEKLKEARSAGLSIDLYVDGRYGSHSTSDLREEALTEFIQRAFAMTRLLSADPNRGLADPKHYEGRSDVDLELEDPDYESLETETRRSRVAEIEAAALAVEGPIISATSFVSDVKGWSVQLHSNGFEGQKRTTRFSGGASVSIDDGDRRPSDGVWRSARFSSDLPTTEFLGRESATRALLRRGQGSLESGQMHLVIENRAVGRLLGHLLKAFYGSALQQERSFLLDAMGTEIASKQLTLIDDPFVPRGLGSRYYDGDGISASKRALIEEGVLKGNLIDVYYGRKMGVEPTGGSTSNLTFGPGERDLDGILKDLKSGVFVTDFLGGNSDTSSGDFSLGIIGFAIEDGALTKPVGEMNIAGNHKQFWKKLVEVGNDPYFFSSTRAPTLVFEGVDVSGA